MKTGVRLFLASDGTTIFGKIKEEILKEITGTYGNTGQTTADAQSRLGNSKVKSGIQSVRGDDAGNRGAEDTRQRRGKRGRGIGTDGNGRGSRDSRRSGQISANPAIRESNKAVRTGMTREEALSIVASMEEHAEVAPELSLTPENWAEIFDENNSITTPVGQVKMGDNQINKFFAKGREKSFGMVAPTLSNPDVVIEKDAQSPNAERNTKYLFIKTFIKSDGSRYVHFETVTVRKDGMEVSISSHEVDRKVAKKEMQNGIILHLNNKLSLDSERYLIETQNDGRPDLVPASDNNISKSQGNVFAPITEDTNVPQFNSPTYKYSKKNPIIRERREKNAQEEESAEQQSISAEKATAQRAYDYWTAQQARRIGASQRKAPQVTQQVGENITGKYQTSNRTYGNADTYILPNGEKINGRYVIVEADAITPSHDVNNGYQKSEGFPTDENGNTINDRDYQADKSAQTIVEQNAANYDARAIQTPVIVTNQGIVLSGNGRTMSGQIAASQGTDTEYLSYLKDHAGRYGFTADQISGYQHPRLVLEVSDNVPLNAETFAKFNAEDKKTISPTEKAVKAGKTVTDITLEKIAALLDDKETLSDVYADETATAQIIKILQSDGVINNNEVAELMDGKKLSAQGKDFLETLLVGKILNEQSVRLVAQMRNIRATVIKSIMPLLNNSRLRKGQNGENYSLSDELNKAIEFIYAADRANMPITDYISQTNLFDANPADIYDTVTQIIAVALTKGQNNFKQFVNKYNTAAEHAASGQIDIFAGRIKTKKEILKEITGTYGNTGQAAADTQSRLGNSKVKSGIQSVRGDDAGNRGADTGGRGTDTGGQGAPVADTAQPAAAEQTTETPAENSNLSENEVRNATSPLGGDSNLSDIEERYRESGEPVSRQKQTGIPYRLSGELDENGHPFVLASDGTTTFGEIRADSGLQPAPIKLSRGIQDENGKGYGLLHIEANHGEEIRKAGFSSVNDFVSFIAHNYDKDNIRVGKRRHNGNITYLLQVTDSHDNTLFIEMSRDGSYWNVNSAGVFRKKYSNKKETVVKTEPQQPNNAISAGSSLSENEERGITSSEPNGEPPVSNSKYSKESSNVQEPLRHRTGEEAGSRDIIDMTEEELAEIRAKEREKIDRIFGKEYLDNVAKAVEKRKAERKAVVSKAARELRSELTTSPDIVLVSDLKDIPEEDLQGKTPQEAIRRMRAKGWYTPGNGKVYINLSMHSTAEDVKATILHEAVAHKGLRALLGEESFGALCDAVYRSMPKKRQKAYEDTYKNIYPNAAEAELRRIIADEYMARLAEGGVRQSIPQRIISAIREFLRSIGIDLDINDADIRHLLAQSYKNMQEADAVKVLDNSALLARLRKAAEETHIKSEAESLYRLGDNNKTFSERVNRAVENKGTVMPNLAEENLKVINIPKHKYKGSVGEVKKQAEEDARKKYQGKTLYYDNYGTAFDYTISGESIEKSISKKATDKSTNIGIHIAVLNRLDEVIANSIEVEEHPDYKKGADEERRPENGYNANTLIHRFYGAIKIDGIVYRVKTTMKESRSAVEGNKQYSYEVTNVERLNADALSRSNGVGGLTSSREDALPLAKIIEKETKSYEKGKKILEASRESDIRFRFTPEEQQVSIAAQADGTWMKAPNGKPTNLTERQWVQVRTKAFKEWFGDWEKAARIGKLLASEPVEITGKEVTPSDDLKQYKKNALEYGKNLRSEYTNKDTGETLSLTAGNSRGGIREILQHDYKDVEHLQSIAAIPHIIENSIFIDEQPNEDLERYPGVKSFSYYVCGLKIGGVDYTVKAVIANQNNGERYYDHKLTNIEKGELLSIVPTIQKAGIDSKTPYIGVKDKRLLSLLQTNSSKVVDENGEPMVVYHGTNESFHTFDKNKAGISRNTCERQGRIGRNIWQKFFPERIRDSQKADGRKNGRINNLENKKSYSHRRKSYKNDAYFGFEQNFQHQR